MNDVTGIPTCSKCNKPAIMFTSPSSAGYPRIDYCEDHRPDFTNQAKVHSKDAEIARLQQDLLDLQRSANARIDRNFEALTQLRAELALLKSERDAAVAKALEEVIAGIRRMKYSDRGEGLEDMDPHCDDHPDYERAMLDEFAEEIIASIRRAAEARDGET